MAKYVSESQPAIIDVNPNVFVRVLGIGAVVGIVIWVLTFLLSQYVLRGGLCAGETVCNSSAIYAGNISAVIAAFVGLFALVRADVYRPLLIVLLSAVTLWGMGGWFFGLNLFEALLYSVVLYILAYVAYTWLARIRSTPVMVVVVVLIAILTRYIPTLV